MNIGTSNTEHAILLIAEVGNNHEGNLETAKTLVREAAAAGAGAVKFQTFQTERFVSAADAARFKRLKSFELSQQAFRELHDLARSLRLLFLSTPLDLNSAKFLEPLVDAYKIASCDNNFYPLLKFATATRKPILLSGGLLTDKELVSAKAFIEAEWKGIGFQGQLAVLHCVSSYPVPDEQANLAAIPHLRNVLQIPVGYSDHTIGNDACLAAAALGATIIEKHFTLDKNYSDFRDHQLSADPADLTFLAKQLRKIPTLVGKPQKIVQPCEASNMPLLRRSIAASTDLPSGHQVQETDLMWIRPGHGLPPGQENKLTGKRLKRAVVAGEFIQTADVE